MNMPKVKCVSALSVLTVITSMAAHAGNVEALPSVFKLGSMFTPTGIMADKSMPKYPNTLTYKVESGEYQGFKYMVDYAYANATVVGSEGASVDDYVKNWHVSCAKDPMNDSVSCLTLRGDLYISYSRKGGYRISVGLEHYPGYSVSVRIGAGKPYSTTAEGNFSSATSSKIIEAMKQSGIARTRYVKWPYAVNIDTESSLYGLPAVLAFMKWAVMTYK